MLIFMNGINGYTKVFPSNVPGILGDLGIIDPEIHDVLGITLSISAKVTGVDFNRNKISRASDIVFNAGHIIGLLPKKISYLNLADTGITDQDIYFTNQTNIPINIGRGVLSKTSGTYSVLKEIFVMLKKFPKLTHLDLSANKLGIATAYSLAESFLELPPWITKLSLAGNDLGNLETTKIIDLFKALPSNLKHLNLDDNILFSKSNEDLKKILEAIPPNLESLNLGLQEFSFQEVAKTPDQLFEILLDLPQNLSKLSLDSRMFYQMPVDAIVRILSILPPRLTGIALSSHHLDDRAANDVIQIVNALPRELTELSIQFLDRKTADQIVNIINKMPPNLTKLELRYSLYGMKADEIAKIFAAIAAKFKNLETFIAPQILQRLTNQECVQIFAPFIRSDATTRILFTKHNEDLAAQIKRIFTTTQITPSTAIIVSTNQRSGCYNLLAPLYALLYNEPEPTIDTILAAIPEEDRAAKLQSLAVHLADDVKNADIFREASGVTLLHKMIITNLDDNKPIPYFYKSISDGKNIPVNRILFNLSAKYLNQVITELCKAPQSHDCLELIHDLLVHAISLQPIIESTRNDPTIQTKLTNNLVFFRDHSEKFGLKNKSDELIETFEELFGVTLPSQEQSTLHQSHRY